MTRASLEAVAGILAEIGDRDVFTARRATQVDDLDLEVTGVGKLDFPVSKAQAKALRRVARPAHYGQGEKTLLDPGVRDTWKIAKSRVKIDRRRWNRTLLPVLDALGSELGLADGARLKAELHAMLLYDPGQFFAPHQDSETSDDMVGTLVVLLPSEFRGGSLIVEHRGETVTYRGSKTKLTFVAFYADCRHEVKPVRSGFRMALTFNLLLRAGSREPGAPAREVDSAVVGSLSRRLREHFERPLPARRYAARGTGAPEMAPPPNRLVYLLDHQYTPRSLAWHRLKGSDRVRSTALREAAEQANCELVLALAEVEEKWSCFEPGWDDGWRRRHRSWVRDEEDHWIEDDPIVDSPESCHLEELLDWGITLESWIGPTGANAEPIVTAVSEDEVCSTTPSSELEAHASEYEGYMGNYGNTMDRWYRRAAIVLWPRERSFAVHAEAAPARAMREFQGRLRSDDLTEARKMAATLAPFWEAAVGRVEDAGFLLDVTRVAEGLGDAELAQTLLRPFRLEQLSPRDASAIVGLVGCYGEDWWKELLAAWSASGARRGRRAPADKLGWIASIPQLCRSLLTASDRGAADRELIGASVARILLRNRWAHLEEEIRGVARMRSPSRREKAALELAGPIRGILAAALLAAETSVARDVVATFRQHDDDALLSCLVRVLRDSVGDAEARSGAPAPLAELRDHAVEALRARLDRPARAENDWSLVLPPGCDCELCTELGSFLADADRVRFEWPINKERRQHVHRRIDDHEIPVRHQTRRSGSPYTLVLEKREELFEREANRHRSWRADLERLTRN